jgi:rod shape-determining protein MreC
MRDLFRFLWRSRSTLLFIALMALSFVWLANGNDHHRAQAFTSSQAAVGTVYGWRDQVVRYTDLDGDNERLALAMAELLERSRGSFISTTTPVHIIRDTVLQQQYEYYEARVINGTIAKQRNFLTLDKGTKAGLQKDMGVIGPTGIVGKVYECSPRFSTVMSVLNSDFVCSVALPRAGHFGLLNWDTADPLSARVKDVPKHAPIEVGDTVVTRGVDMFPKGTMVGIVSGVANPPGAVALDIVVQLSEDLSRSNHVWVVNDLLQLERDTLEQNTVTE